MNNESTVPASEQLHDLDTIAGRLNVATKTVRRMIARGELGYHQVGRLKRVSDGQYLEYLSRVRRAIAEGRHDYKATASRAAWRARILTRRISASSKPLSSAGSFEPKASISRRIPEETLDVGHDELTHVLRHL